MLHRYSKLAAMAALLVLAGTAAAQRQFPFGGFGGGGAVVLLANTDVQQELKLRDEQITKAKEVGSAVRDKFKDKFADLKDVPQEQRREKFQEIMKAVSAETDKALKDVPEMAREMPPGVVAIPTAPFPRAIASESDDKQLSRISAPSSEWKAIRQPVSLAIATIPRRMTRTWPTADVSYTPTTSRSRAAISTRSVRLSIN